MKLMLSGIALLALLTACDDSDTDGNTEQDSGATETATDEETDETATDDEETDETATDDEETDETAAGDDAGETPVGNDAAVPPMPPPPPEPISCGDVDCPAPPFGVPCCASAADVEGKAALAEGACGVDLSTVFMGPSACVEFNQPGELDESCPAFEIPNAEPIPGCCTSHGLCGTMDTFIGIGCTLPPPGSGDPIPCGAGAGDAGSTGSGDAGSSSAEDAGGEDTSVLDAGETTVEPTDAGDSTTPAQDASMSTAPDAATDAATDDAGL